MSSMNILQQVKSMAPADLGRVLVVYGGLSAEREVSLKSGSMVLSALHSRGVDAHGFDPAVTSLKQLLDGDYDRAFIALHGRFGEDGTIQGLLEYLRLPYTGSGVLSSAVAMDKSLTKRIWQQQGLTTPDFIELTEDFCAQTVVSRLGLPLITKPAQEGSTLGLTKVTSVEQLRPAFAQAYAYDCQVLAEAFIAGAEVTVPVLGEGLQAFALPPVQISAPGGNYDYHNKYLCDQTQYFCPSGFSDALNEDLKALALKAYLALGCSGWGRADIMLDAQQRPWLLEMNTSPGMTDHSLVPMSARVAGMDYATLVIYLLSQASLKSNIRGQKEL